MKTFSSEMRDFKDPLTGRTIRQLTATGNNYHLYFTENAFVRGENEIIFLSDRASGRDAAPADDPHYNVFRMNLDSGEMTQLTDEDSAVSRATKTPDGRLVVYHTKKHIKALDTLSGKTTLLYTETGNYNLASPSISPNQRYIGFIRNEKTGHEHGPNYSGFKERYYLVKDARITIANLDGSGWYDIFTDTHQLGHFQFSPDDPTIAMFCHEGPWNLVTQRIWLFDLAARAARPIYRQDEPDSIGHEFWTQDGLIFFDNRGPGHDGTITSHRTQAVAVDVKVNENAMIPFVGLANRQGEILRKVELPYYCNHYHANASNTRLVGDDVDNLVLVDLTNSAPQVQNLVFHGTSWHTQSAHCHPTWDWDSNRILYASDRGGKINIYLVEA